MKHGHNQRGRRTTEYEIWAGIRARCNNPKHKLYPYYGGRGITYDPRWEEFLEFLGDVGKRPSLEYTLDRIDNNKGYSKENCKWSTKTEQSRNRRNVISVTINNETKCLKEWANHYSLNYKNVWRQWKNKWPIEKVFPIGQEK